MIPKASIVEKFARAVVEASKQCGRNRLMAIDPPRKWSEYLDMTGIGSRILLHPDPEVPRLTAAMGRVRRSRSGRKAGFPMRK